MAGLFKLINSSKSFALSSTPPILGCDRCRFFQPLWNYRNCTTTIEAKTMSESEPEATSKLDSSKPEKLLVLRPPSYHGMTTLDKSAFTKILTVPTVLVNPSDVLVVSKGLKKYFLKLSKFRSFEVDESTSKKRIFLNPDMVPTTSPELVAFLQTELSHRVEVVTPELVQLTVTYDNWRWWDILKAIIPGDVEATRSFTMVGSLLHLNLRDHLLPYKSVIGQVLLDGVPNVKTVVNKVNTIESTYRNFKMEVLAGDPSTVVKVREGGTDFEFDFATVYWNSRLSSEHQRIVDMLSPGDILFDVFAGVGPFCVPVAKKKCFVLANDLNPESYRWLVHNVDKTKRAKPYVATWNLDGRQFIREQLPHLIRPTPQVPFSDYSTTWTNHFHITMNLPAIAVEFLTAFWNLVDSSDNINPNVTITVHVYCFIKSEAEEPERQRMALNLVKTNLRYDLSEESVQEVFCVRNVAPNKNMYRVTFRLPLEILSMVPPPPPRESPVCHDSVPLPKRRKIEDEDEED